MNLSIGKNPYLGLHHSDKGSKNNIILCSYCISLAALFKVTQSLLGRDKFRTNYCEKYFAIWQIKTFGTIQSWILSEQVQMKCPRYGLV